MSQGKEIKYEEKIPHGNDAKSTEGDVTDRLKAGPFLWGAATSSYQVEGGITNNDWDFFTRSEKVRDRIVKLTSVAAAASNSDKDNKKNKSNEQSSSPEKATKQNHQSSGYQPQWQLEQLAKQRSNQDIIRLQPAGVAVNAWDSKYYEQDFDNAVRLGLNALRISLEWSRIQPEENKWDNDSIEHYRNMINSMRSRGLTPIITLNHFTLPLWVSTPPMEFSRNLLANAILPPKMKHLPLVDPIAADPYWKSLKGWESHRTVDAFIKYVSKMVNEFKDIVDYWITLSEPVASVVGIGYIAGIWPPGFVLDGGRAKIALHNLIEAHVQAYDKITAIDNIDSDGDGISKRVGFSHSMVAVSPGEPTKFFGRKIVDNTDSAKNFSYFINDYFLNAVVFGEEDLNYLNKLKRQKEQSKDFIIHDEWKDKLDFVGVNYYRKVYVNYSNILALSSARFFGGMLINNLKGHDKHQTHGLLSDLGWEVYPEGLYDTIMQIKTRWNKPVMVTENGIAEKLDKYRAPYIVAHIEQVKRAIDNGAKVLGYIYWSLMDNYEWQEGYRPEGRFGLYYVDRNHIIIDDEYDSSNNKPLNSNNNKNDNDNDNMNYLGRTIKEGAKALQFIIGETHGTAITDIAISKAKSIFGTFTPDGTDLIYPSS